MSEPTNLTTATGANARLQTSSGDPKYFFSTLGLSDAERDRRWSAMRVFMKREGIDVLVLPPDSDPQAIADARYLAGFSAAGTAVLFFAAEEPEAITATGLEYLWMERASWARAFYGKSGVLAYVSERLKSRGRNLAIGVPTNASLSPAWLDALTAASTSAPHKFDNALRKLRAIKSDEEIALIRHSCQIADNAIAYAIGRTKAGLPQQFLRADADHSVLSAGAEATSGSFTVYPRRRVPFGACSYLAEQPLAVGDVAMLEVTPSARGYRSQLATHVSIGEPPAAYRRMYEVSVAARRAALELLKPGANLREFVGRMQDHVESAGLEFIGEAGGHVLGLTTAEPRIRVGVDFELRPGVALVLHAVVANADKEEMLRGDTYLITDDGFERLNAFTEDLVVQ